MKKILMFGIFYFMFICNVNSNGTLEELINKLNENKGKYYNFSYKYYNFLKEDKLFLIPKIFPSSGVSIWLDKSNILLIHIENSIFVEGIKDYKILKNDNKFTISGIDINLEGAIKNRKFEFIFDGNFLIIIPDNIKSDSYLFYIDKNGEIEKRHEYQRKNYLYKLTKDSEKNDLIIIKENKIYKIRYNDKLYSFIRVEPIYNRVDFYNDKFVLVLSNLDKVGFQNIPVEIINNSIKIIKDKKLIEPKPGFFKLE